VYHRYIRGHAGYMPNVKTFFMHDTYEIFIVLALSLWNSIQKHICIVKWISRLKLLPHACKI
jgi:hypothetical protein